MIHYFNLNPEPFEKIVNKTKTIELRLFDEKRQKIKIDDIIVFSNNDNSVKASVKNLYLFDSFKELYKKLDLTKCGYDESNIGNANYTDMNEYYSDEQIESFGAVGIEIEVIG